MKLIKYNVTCLKCKKSDEVSIVDERHIDWNHSTTNHIISARKRLDNEFGFQCKCGNNDILSEQEKRNISDKQNPDPQEVAEIVRNLEPQKAKFKLEIID